jgi:hypothetical protein
VLNWAACGLWEEYKPYVLSDKEVTDKKQLVIDSRRRYETSTNGKEKRRRYERSTNRKEKEKRHNQRRTYTSGEAGNKRARVLQESTWKSSSRPAGWLNFSP